jgi:hypothetical protein
MGHDALWGMSFRQVGAAVSVHGDQPFFIPKATGASHARRFISPAEECRSWDVSCAKSGVKRFFDGAGERHEIVQTHTCFVGRRKIFPVDRMPSGFEAIEGKVSVSQVLKEIQLREFVVRDGGSRFFRCYLIHFLYSPAEENPSMSELENVVEGWSLGEALHCFLGQFGDFIFLRRPASLYCPEFEVR